MIPVPGSLSTGPEAKAASAENSWTLQDWHQIQPPLHWRSFPAPQSSKRGSTTCGPCPLCRHRLNIRSARALPVVVVILTVHCHRGLHKSTHTIILSLDLLFKGKKLNPLDVRWSRNILGLIPSFSTNNLNCGEPSGMVSLHGTAKNWHL